MIMIKKLHLFKFVAFAPLFCFSNLINSKTIDTLAFQDFEVVPQSPTWNYTGTPSAFLSGITTGSQAPAGVEMGINNSRAWHISSATNPVDFNNQIIPSGYDSIRVTFRLAAMNLNNSAGGPDYADYVLVSYSTDNGSTFVNRIRVRGATNDNSHWPYHATRTAKAYYLPATEALFHPSLGGLQLSAGVSTVELVFPGSISQLSLKITPRASSISDSWFIDNLLLVGESTSSVGIEENDVESFISVYPNPTKGLFNLSLGQVSDNATVVVYDMLGKEVINQQLKSQSTLIDLTGNDKGIYFVKILNGDQIITKRIVKQ